MKRFSLFIFALILPALSYAVAIYSLTDIQQMFVDGLNLRGKPTVSTPVTPTALPLATWSDFTYAGAFKLPTTTTVDTYSPAIIGWSTTAGNFFMSDTAPLSGTPKISEYTMPALSSTTDVNALPNATLVQQTLDLSTAPNGTVEPMDKVGGIYPYNNQLIVTVSQQYDAAADNVYGIARVGNPSDFTNPQLGGYYQLQGAFKASGWISEVPQVWQSLVGANHIVGNASNWSIIGRASVGPSMYAINLDDVIAPTPSEPIQTTPLITYDLNTGQQLQQQVNPAWDLANTSLTNNIWTYTAKASFGFIVPGTRTYAVFGFISGLNSGIGYKITTNQGRLCPGYCAQDDADWDHYIWFYDMNDILDAKNGNRPLYSVVPYAYHTISTPFSKAQGATEQLYQRGGMYDYQNNRLYLSINDAHDSGFSTRPVVVAYDLTGVTP